MSSFEAGPAPEYPAADPRPRRPERRTTNPFLTPWALDAAASHLVASRHVELVAAGGEHGAALPLSRWLGAPPMPVSVWSVWKHLHCFDTTPIGDQPAATLDAAFSFLNDKRNCMLFWSGLPTDTPFYREMLLYLERTGLAYERVRTRARPLLRAGSRSAANGEAARGLVDKCGAESRRRRKKLARLGGVSERVYDAAHDAAAWMDDFLALEASGWKGASGTALACNPGERAYFETLMTAAAAQGRALVYSLELDGEPVAMTVNLRAGKRVWGFKTAYRSDLAKYAPGAIAFYETTAHALGDPSIEWMDSCMESDDGMVGRLWPDRRETVDLMIATKRSSNWLPRPAKFALNAMRRARSMTAPLFWRHGPAAG